MSKVAAAFLSSVLVLGLLSWWKLTLHGFPSGPKTTPGLVAVAVGLLEELGSGSMECCLSLGMVNPRCALVAQETVMQIWM